MSGRVYEHRTRGDDGVGGWAAEELVWGRLYQGEQW